jgi:xylulokinase
MADIYGIPLHRLAILEEATSMGAAVIGGVGVGLYPSFDIAQQMNSIAETIHPMHSNRDTYAQLYTIFEAAYQALEPVFDLFAK